jgi:hypothetical protein
MGEQMLFLDERMFLRGGQLQKQAVLYPFQLNKMAKAILFGIKHL